MQAWFARQYGGPEVLRLEEVPTPIPASNQLLVRVHATSVNSGDRRVRSCDLPPGTKLLGRLALGWNGPRQPVLGTEYAGVVEAVGAGVSSFKRGDPVYAFPGGKMGAHAQYVLVNEAGPVAHLPEGLDFHQAAALCFGGTTAIHFLRKAKLLAGEKVLVLGGSGAVGLALVQLARHRGAHVTATTSAPNVVLLLDHGADTVIDYRTSDVAALSERFDVIADCVGALDFRHSQNLLKPNGRYLAIAGALREMLGALRKGKNNTSMIAGPAGERATDVRELGRLAASGLYKPYIDKVFAFGDMPLAHAYVDTGRKRGSVIIDVGQ